MKELVAKVLVITWKDVMTELRTKETVTAVLVFALLVLVIFNFAFDPEAGTTGLVAPGILWVALIFAGMLGLNRLFAMEKQNSCIEGLMLCPVDRAVIYWGKLVGTFSFMLVVAIVVTPVFLALLGLPLLLPRLVPIIVLALAGFAAVGTLFSALAMNTRARDIMLPILVLPIIVPVIIAGVEATSLVLSQSPWEDVLTWLQIMIAFDVIYLVVATLAFESVIER